MPNLQSHLDALARAFAEQIVDSIRRSSLHELIASSAATQHVSEASDSPAARAARSKRRLTRRSGDEIRTTLNKIVLLVKTQKSGLRAEQIRSKLGMQAKEMPRILKEGIATNLLCTKGQKRATTYFAVRPDKS